MQIIDKLILCKSYADEFYLYPLGDIHIGAFNCAEGHVKRFIDHIRHKKNALWFGGGDLTDCITPKDVSRYDANALADWIFTGNAMNIKEALTDIARQQRNRICEWLAPIKDKCIGLIEGNHEADIAKWSHNAQQLMLCEQLQVMNLTGESLIRFRFVLPKKGTPSSGESITMFVMHGFGGGRTAGAEPNHLARLAAMTEADIHLRGHCFSEDTEILTIGGWKNYAEISMGDTIYNFDMKNNCIQQDTIKQVFVYDDYKELVNIKNTHTDLLVTDKHEIIYKYLSQRPNKHYIHKWLKRQAGTFNRSFHVLIPCASILKQEDYNIPDCWVRLLGLIISEGHFRKNCNKTTKRQRNPHSGLQIYQRQGNESYIRETLNACKLDYSEYNKKDKGKISIIRGKSYQTKNNTIVFYIKEHSAKKIRMLITQKYIPNFVFKFSERQFSILLESLIYGDGSIKGNEAYCYFAKDKILMNQLQALCAIFGYRTVLLPHRDNWDLHIAKRQTTMLTRNTKGLQKAKYSGKVWCVNTVNGSVIVRRNGKVSITGNSHCFEIAPPQIKLYIPKKGALPDECLQREILNGNWGCWVKSYAKGPSTYDSRRAYPPRPLLAMEIVIKPFHYIKVQVCGRDVTRIVPAITMQVCRYD